MKKVMQGPNAVPAGVKKVSYFQVPGSDPNATMKNDNPQQVPYATKPGTKPKKPKPVKSGGVYRLPKR